jgi:hypothetical protein
LYITTTYRQKMVKNTSGGTRTKGLARKHQGGGHRGQLRVPECEFEQVAYVSKMLGNGMCHVFINDKTQPLIAHIRKKFSGRHKRSNLIAVGTCLLIGLREWENPCKNCDVINVYDQNEFQNILDIPSIPTDFIKPLLHNLNFDHKNDDEFKFCDQDEVIDQNLHLELQLHQHQDQDLHNNIDLNDI